MKHLLCILFVGIAASALGAETTVPTGPASSPSAGGASWKIYESSAQGIADDRDAKETEKRKTLADEAGANGQFC